MTNQIELPSLFAELLHGSDYEASVLDTRDKCAAFLGDPTRGLRLFPEYTDHGIRHVQQVVEACAQLVAPIAQKLLTPADAAVMTTAALLHDSGMHLTEDSFITLVSTTCTF